MIRIFVRFAKFSLDVQWYDFTRSLKKIISNLEAVTRRRKKVIASI